MQRQQKSTKNIRSKRGKQSFKRWSQQGCHDDALTFATLCRAAGLPSRYLAGLDKLDPKNQGHCLVETDINKEWILIDQS